MDTRPVPPGLEPFWSGTLADFATITPAPIDPGQCERHRMYSLLLMSILLSQWNGNKYGPVGNYGQWRAQQMESRLPSGGSLYQGGTYLGHNIAAIAVDGEGHVIDYDFNHNNAFDSSVEHAESRLIRRVFALNQVYAPWSAPGAPGASLRTERAHQRHQVFATHVTERRGQSAAATASPSAPAASVGAGQGEVTTTGYSTLLNDVTLYTSLESCAQCSGIMTLASVKEVVYLQWDQGEFLIGNMMRQATASGSSGFTAPLPVSADEFGFQYFTQLNAGNDAFSSGVATEPFFSGEGFSVTTPSITSYLCTDGAKTIYEAGANELSSFTVVNPTYVPPGAPPAALTNAEVLTEVQNFLSYAKSIDNRGTPHRV
jgi:tRNA(Arg) A34 adenosine deaminase TadA